MQLLDQKSALEEEIFGNDDDLSDWELDLGAYEQEVEGFSLLRASSYFSRERATTGCGGGCPAKKTFKQKQRTSFIE